MYYVTEHCYEGPNPDENLDADYFAVSTIPALTNMSHEVRTEGWCGTTGDWAVYAHGEFKSEEEAVESIKAMFDGVREVEDDDRLVDDCVAMFKPGQYEPISPETLMEWMDAYTVAKLEAAKTQAELEAFLTALEGELNSFDCTLGTFGQNHVRGIWEEARAGDRVSGGRS